jgi:hypothetical protein
MKTFKEYSAEQNAVQGEPPQEEQPQGNLFDQAGLDPLASSLESAGQRIPEHQKVLNRIWEKVQMLHQAGRDDEIPPVPQQQGEVSGQQQQPQQQPTTRVGGYDSGQQQLNPFQQQRQQLNQRQQQRPNPFQQQPPSPN